MYFKLLLSGGVREYIPSQFLSKLSKQRKVKKIVQMFTKRDVSVEGFVEKPFLAVREAFQENFTNGEELSAQLCVVQDGKVVVDLWGSVEDQTYTGDSVQLIWSSTKNLTALAVAMLVDR